MTIEDEIKNIVLEIIEIKKLLSKNKEPSKDEDGSKYMTVKEFCKKHTYPTESAVRAFIFGNNSKYNPYYQKFNGVFKKIGRRVLINVDEFWKCIDGQNKKD